MGSLNKAIIVGNLGQDPDYRATDTGSVCRLNVATNEVWKDKDGEKKESTTWHNVSVWGKQAESCRDYLKKGSSVLVEGSIARREYVNKDGNKVRDSGIKANRVIFMSSGGGASKATDGGDYETPFG